MNTKEINGLVRGLSLAQSIVAPSLMIIGTRKNKSAIRNAGMIWSGLIALDAVRLTWGLLKRDETIDDLEEHIYNFEEKTPSEEEA